MKKTILLTFLPALFILSGCKSGSKHRANFYTTISPSTPLRLFVDGIYQGTLPSLSASPSCANDSLMNLTLPVVFGSGKHEITAHDTLGTIVSQTTLKIRNNRISMSSHKGGSELTSTDCMIVKLF